MRKVAFDRSNDPSGRLRFSILTRECHYVSSLLPSPSTDACDGPSPSCLLTCWVWNWFVYFDQQDTSLASTVNVNLSQEIRFTHFSARMQSLFFFKVQLFCKRIISIRGAGLGISHLHYFITLSVIRASSNSVHQFENNVVKSVTLLWVRWLL